MPATPDRALSMDEVAALAASELRALARAYMRGERPSHTLQPTALANEAFMRLLNREPRAFASEGAFLRYASEAMRHLLVDHARRHTALKRGGGRTERLGGRDAGVEAGPSPEDLLALHEALVRLESEHARAAAVVKMRFFGGASFPEIAAAMGIGQRTAEKDWAGARAWLRGVLDGCGSRAAV